MSNMAWLDWLRTKEGKEEKQSLLTYSHFYGTPEKRSKSTHPNERISDRHDTDRYICMYVANMTLEMLSAYYPTKINEINLRQLFNKSWWDTVFETLYTNFTVKTLSAKIRIPMKQNSSNIRLNKKIYYPACGMFYKPSLPAVPLSSSFFLDFLLYS